ncbi:MAG: hypothetical protein GY814_02600 [Gammaproteobacteria bacterium]|nr:hypothetical protein [Gammaproteobacteria bacterium]
MKGIVFTGFLDFVAEQFSLDMVDDIIDASDLPSEGAYTAVGTYDYQEMAQLVSALGRISGLPVADLVASFGQHLFGIFVKNYPDYIDGIDSTFSFLLAVEKTIHVEVFKLYPDAELPRFEYEFPESNHKRVFDLVMRFGTSKSPKRTSIFDNLLLLWPSRSLALRDNIASSLPLRCQLPNDWTPCLDAYFASPLAQGTPG